MDLVSASLHAAAARNLTAPALIFGAGVVTSIGPCVAPRFVAIAGVAAGAKRGTALRLALAFCAGVTASFATLGAAATLLAQALRYSGLIYAVLSAILAIAGLVTLWRDEPHSECHDARRRTSFGAVFLLGASSAFVLSPCCSPIVAGIIAYSSAAGDPLYGAGMLAIFSAGHVLPVLAAAIGASKAGSALSRLSAAHAGAVLSGSLMLGLAAYYAVLA